VTVKYYTLTDLDDDNLQGILYHKLSTVTWITYLPYLFTTFNVIPCGCFYITILSVSEQTYWIFGLHNFVIESQFNINMYNNLINSIYDIVKMYRNVSVCKSQSFYVIIMFFCLW